MNKNARLILTITSILLVIFLACSFLVSSLLLSLNPVYSQASDGMDYAALVSANIKLRNEYSYLNKSGERDRPREIVFSTTEVNALLTMSVSCGKMLNVDNGIFSDIIPRFQNGIFYINASKEISFLTLFQSYININSSFILDIRNSDLKFDLLSLKVGKILVPKILIDYLLKQKKEDLNKSPLIHKLLKSIKEVHAYNDRLIIVYYPKNLGEDVSNFMYSIQHKMKFFN